jgi:hypothetical protein
VFDLPKQQEHGLANVQLEFTMTDWDRVTKNEVIINQTSGLRPSSYQTHRA